MKVKKICALVLSITMVATMVTFNGCALGGGEKPSTGSSELTSEPSAISVEDEETLFRITDAGGRVFLINKDVQPDIPAYTPSVEEYQVAADLSNIENAERLYISEDMKNLLVKNNFVVVTGNYNEFFDVYEDNRYVQFPSFVTVDSMMHTYHLYFAMLQKNTELNYLSSTMEKMSTTLLNASIQQYNELEGTEWEAAAKLNIGFFAVGAKLMNDSTEVPDVILEEVEAELALISGAQGIEVSPLFLDKEDYSQYKPRGYYDGDDVLERYFRTMMWYGRRNFTQKEILTDQSALLMSLAINQESMSDWEEVYSITSFFAGASDDSGLYEYLPIIKSVYSENVSCKDLVNNSDAFERYHKLTGEIEPPQINSVIHTSVSPEDDVAEISRGFRFMGQRFSVDASIFTQLCYNNVGSNANGEYRLLPDPLDVPAALGSNTALSILEQNGNFTFNNYEEQMVKTQRDIASAPDTFWTASLYSGWMNTLRPLLKEKGKGYPSFMQSEEWNKKSIETFLGSYTELKHDTVLYSKQFIAEMGGGDEEILDDRGYVEPEVEVYAYLSALAQNTSLGLQSYGIINQNDQDNLSKLATLADSLKEISVKELNNESLTEEEYGLIREIGGNLEHFWHETVLDAENGDENYKTSQEYPAALVVDTATDGSSGSVLEQAIGGVSPIYVAVPIDGKIRVAKGAVFTYYQFTQPINNRLTDSQWRQMLGMELNEQSEYELDNTITQPEWTQSYRYIWQY